MVGTPELAGLNTPDTSILPDDVHFFTWYYREKLAKADCLLVLTNEGVLNYASKLPPCGGFFYPVYAGVPAGDQQLADWLLKNPQGLAVVETELWSDNIDGNAMSNRLPKVWAAVNEGMPVRVKIDRRIFAVPH